MAVLSKRTFFGGVVLVIGVLAAWQDRVRNMPLDILHLCGVLQVLGEGGEALAATEQSRRLLGLRQLRRVEVRRGQMWWVGLWRHRHGVIRGHSEMDPAGEGVLGFVLEVRVWTLKKERRIKRNSDRTVV